MSRTIVAITGASSGIGAVFARKLAAEHDLLLIARRGSRLRELAAELSTAHGTKTEILEADLTKDSDLDTAAGAIAAEPRLALLVNNAGFGTKGLFWESSLESQEQMHRLHVMATMRLTHAALGNMVPRDHGAVINVASVAAFVRRAGTASYSATKSWMTVFTEALHLELKSIHSQVSVQALCPGFTYSEFHDTMGVERRYMAGSAFWMSAEDVVNASLSGLHQHRLFVIPGWRYRMFTALFSKLPTGVRLALESRSVPGSKRASLGSSSKPPKLVDGV